MIRIFVTGDNHIGKKFDRYPEIREALSESRRASLRDAVRRAEAEECDVLAVTGDLFDSVTGVRSTEVREVVEILAEFPGTVLVLPGNHDYHTGEEKVWKDFERMAGSVENNIIFLKTEAPLKLRVREESVEIFPAVCRSKHSEENALGWIKRLTAEAQEGPAPDFRIGIAHGALEGLAPDMKNEYFRMTESELLKIPMDVWLIGHTHIPYPDLSEDRAIDGFRIFNAGTHEQTDLHNRTEGWCFLLTLEKQGTGTRVLARKVKTGRMRFHDLSLSVSEGSSLESQVQALTEPLADAAVVRLALKGTASPEDYADRARILDRVLGRFMNYEIVDDELSEAITAERIRAEFPEIGFASRFLTELLTDPKEAQMAYSLVIECREEGARA